MKFLLIDNYDSFTFNLKALFEEAGIDVLVLRNDALLNVNMDEYDALIISPGPSLPKDAGDLLKLINENPEIPTLGICLGMQAIGEVYGAELELLKDPLHGIQTTIIHFYNELFEGIPSHFLAARYHSWQINKNVLGNQIQIIAEDEYQNPMAIKVSGREIYGLQFHPESILTPKGKELTQNFIERVKNIKNEKFTQQIA